MSNLAWLTDEQMKHLRPCQPHARIGNQRHQPAHFIVHLVALQLHGTDNLYRDGAADGYACIPIIIDIGKWGGDGNSFLRHSKVEHGADGAKDPGNAAPGKPLLDQRITEGIGVCLGVVRQWLISADVNNVAAGPMCSPVEGLRPAKTFRRRYVNTASESIRASVVTSCPRSGVGMGRERPWRRRCLPGRSASWFAGGTNIRPV